MNHHQSTKSSILLRLMEKEVGTHNLANQEDHKILGGIHNLIENATFSVK